MTNPYIPVILTLAIINTIMSALNLWHYTRSHQTFNLAAGLLGVTAVIVNVSYLVTHWY